MPDLISVIMPCWVNDEETLELTIRAVDSIRSAASTGYGSGFNSLPAKINLIIIDNGSTFGGGKMREMADVYIRNKTNLGYAKAVNQGLKLSGPICAVANNDIVVAPNWWTVAEEILIDPMVGTIHYRMIYYDDEFNPGNDIWVQGKERWCSGSFFVMRNKWLFDENFLNSYDDWDLQFRIREEGFATVYTNRAEYKHLDSHTQKKVPEREDNNKRNREYFRVKNGGYPEDLFEKGYPDQMLTSWRPFP